MKVIVAGNYHFSDSELFEIKNSVPSNYPCEAHRAEEFQAEEILPLIQIIFNPIMEGFLKELGKNIWTLFISKISTTIKQKKGQTDIEFSFQSETQRIGFRVRTDNSKVFEKSFTQLIKIIENEQFLKYSDQEFVFNQESNEWEVI